MKNQRLSKAIDDRSWWREADVSARAVRRSNRSVRKSRGSSRVEDARGMWCEWPDRTRRSHRNTSVWIGGGSTRFPRWSRALRVEVEGECDPHHARVHRCNICTDNDATRCRDANILWFVHYITHLIPVQMLMVESNTI